MKQQRHYYVIVPFKNSSGSSESYPRDLPGGFGPSRQNSFEVQDPSDPFLLLKIETPKLNSDEIKFSEVSLMEYRLSRRVGDRVAIRRDTNILHFGSGDAEKDGCIVCGLLAEYHPAPRTVNVPNPLSLEERMEQVVVCSGPCMDFYLKCVCDLELPPLI